eukprot:TRINITY_DN4541_c0_g1_i4.p1 TRINITY_DN4541_c0_g1~~TRINITY_DN4541_c0_g1_i4.p1  ORF type:complete len:603 (-),score=85.92 TRINITY_DN4541_c0_g1_i4:229-2037(-)
MAMLPSATEYCRYGISVLGLEMFASGYAISSDTTTTDACHLYVKPATVPDGWEDQVQMIDLPTKRYQHGYKNRTTGEVQGVAPPGTTCYCEYLLETSGCCDAVSRPTGFLSHAWQFKFASVIQVLKEYMSSNSSESIPSVFWFDVFTVDQHATQTLPLEWWGSTFKEAISMLGHTVMMFSPWSSPLPLKRAWCLWEMYCTVQGGAKFTVALGSSDHAAFEDALLKDGHKSLLDALSNINVAEAAADNPKDHEMIMKAVEATPDGYSGFNALAMAEMRRWVLMIARNMVAARTTPDGALDKHRLKDLMAVARMLLVLGEHTEARTLYENVVDGYVQKRGPSHVKTLQAKDNFATAMKRSNDLKEARKLYEEVIQGYEQQLGVTDSATLRTKSNLCSVLKLLDELDTARALSKDILDGMSSKYCSNHCNTLVAKNNYANLLTVLGEYEEAERFLLEVVSARRNASAAHISTLNAEGNLAGFYSKIGKLEEARPLYEKVISGFTAQLGPVHPETLNSTRNFVLFLNKVGEFEAAQVLCERMHSECSAKLGPSHPDTKEAQKCLWRHRRRSSRRLDPSMFASERSVHRTRLKPEMLSPRTSSKISL